MKPDWKDAPRWANWLIMDNAGNWIWTEKEPWVSSNYGFWCWEGKWERVKTSSYEWRRSKERRP